MTSAAIRNTRSIFGHFARAVYQARLKKAKEVVDQHRRFVTGAAY